MSTKKNEQWTNIHTHFSRPKISNMQVCPYVCCHCCCIHISFSLITHICQTRSIYFFKSQYFYNTPPVERILSFCYGILVSAYAIWLNLTESTFCSAVIETRDFSFSLLFRKFWKTYIFNDKLKKKRSVSFSWQKGNMIVYYRVSQLKTKVLFSNVNRCNPENDSILACSS